MPKNTFYRLPEEKRQRILEAAKQEFFRVPYEEASINKIIKTAEIPRGSFYQYFEDKQDIFLYVLSQQHEKIMEDMVKNIKLAQGDFFRFIYQFIDHFFKMFQSGEYGKILLSMADYEHAGIICQMMRQQDMNQADRLHDMGEQLFNLLDLSFFNIENEEEGKELMNIVGILVRDSAQRMFQQFGKNNEETIYMELRKRIQFLEKHYRKKIGFIC